MFLFTLYNTPKKQITVISLVSVFVRNINIVSTNDTRVVYNKTQLSWALGDGSVGNGACSTAQECSGLTENDFHRLL